MSDMYKTTMRPGILVSMKTFIRGNVKHVKQDLDAPQLSDPKSSAARWETTRFVSDAEEHKRAVKVRADARTLITKVCIESAFGLLCPTDREEALAAAVVDARALAKAFNDSAKVTAISMNIIAGRIAENDTEAALAINAEVRELIESMNSAMAGLSGDNAAKAVETIRANANKLRMVSGMLMPAAREEAQEAIDTARAAARQIVKAGEAAAAEIDLAAAQETLRTKRTAFLNFDAELCVAKPEQSGGGRAIDLPAESPAMIVDVAPAKVAKPKRTGRKVDASDMPAPVVAKPKRGSSRRASSLN